LREQLTYRDSKEIGQSMQSGQGKTALSAFVRAEDGGFEFLL
jgi:hypothetical protein